MSATNVFIKGNLEEQKEAVCKDLGSVPEIPVDLMMKYIIPNSQVDVSATMETLKKGGTWSETAGWLDFNGQTPRELGNMKTHNKETEVFLRLRSVYEKIVSSAKFHSAIAPPPTLSYEQYPNIAPVSDTGVKTRPDGCGVLTIAQAIHTANQRDIPLKEIGKPNWFDIAFVEEYKLEDRCSDTNDNIYKIIWSLHHIMSVDHRRRYAFGLTIGDRTTRIWFCCRQTVLVSQPFDFIKEAPVLVRFIASLAYASPTQLGYDPTVSLRWRGDGWHYDIELTSQMPDGVIRTRIYETTRVICDSANNIRGRATRVYEATVKDPEDSSISQTVVLKDSWVDVGRSKEGDTLAALLEGAKPKEKELFLTVIQHGVVKINGQDDSTEDLILGGQTFCNPPVDEMAKALDDDDDDIFAEEMGMLNVNEHAENSNQPIPKPPSYKAHLYPLYHYPPTFRPGVKPSSSLSKATKTSAKVSTRGNAIDSLPHHTHRVLRAPIVYSPKIHYRIAFEEIGNSLLSVADSGELRAADVSQALQDTTLALRFMAKRGYIHRDVSAGNIILYQNRAKLADLEFAKEYGIGQSSYVRTGTYHFMSGEVARGRYTHQPTFEAFAHNPIHDLESLWWVGVWCTMWHYPVPDDEEVGDSKQEHINLMLTHGNQLFPSYHGVAEQTRIDEIYSPVTYRRRGLGQYDKPMKSFISRLERFRQCIAWAHRKTQKLLPRNDASYFTDVLRVSDPLMVSATDLHNVEDDNPENVGRMRPVFDMIYIILTRTVVGMGVPDQLLWPLDSIKQHSDWLKTKKYPEPRIHAHGAVNVHHVNKDIYDDK
ncbi:hypothetical protein HYPSUDRAFT_156193 [Hypholoma sublateritium FD-334 SS-4]|uniref:Protein kinase domain-containing protein n=1 Tax=Hypholoma sublateritium (strain FD-334 SS-4) TaxID=945553 RepID=A0A0D2LJR0_HYPSF|nr:hypothetical protein HYPSUDRAFT_156193 [Hypholoma sublateritium FD-334 SS-4]